MRGYSTATQVAYVRAVRQLAAYYDKSPDQITEEELRQATPTARHTPDAEAEELQVPANTRAVLSAIENEQP